MPYDIMPPQLKQAYVYTPPKKTGKIDDFCIFIYM